MTNEARYPKTSVSFSKPHKQRFFSVPDSEFTYDPAMSIISASASPVSKIVRNVKLYKRSWDSDKAIKSTYRGSFGKYQLRAYLFLALGYGIVAAWLTEMPVFALLPPKFIDCTPYYANVTNTTTSETVTLNRTLVVLDKNLRKIVIDGQTRKLEPTYNYSKEYGRSVLTDMQGPMFNSLCDETRLKIPHILYLIGLILGGLLAGYLADRSGRQMILLGSMWTACGLSIFQLLSDDYISYVFFIFFLGLAIGAVHVIAIPYVMEMFPIESRAIYGFLLLGIVFLLDLILPWLALLIKNWKILQAVVSLPLVITAILYWITEESMFWYTTKKDYVSAILSLSKIAQFNGVIFEEIFTEARNFLQGKHSVGIQCDFQPLLRLEDIQNLGRKYPDFDMVDLQESNGKKTSFSQRFIQIITGHHYSPTLSQFYPTDILHSSILTIYLLVMCGLWLVSALTEYSLDVPHLTQHLTNNSFVNYFYTHLIQIISFIVAFPLVYAWGRRWPTFCFFLIAEVCLLGSVAVKLDEEQNRAAMLIVYFTGKFATRAAFIVLIIYTCEIFPTGYRCTALGICYTFRLIGILIASPDAGEINDWMPRLIYSILSLILGSMALLLPETKKFPLPRTMMQVEMIPTSVSHSCRHRHAGRAKRTYPTDGGLGDRRRSPAERNSVMDILPSYRISDVQSTVHSIYELQEFGQEDPLNRNLSRRNDLSPPGTRTAYLNTDFDRKPESIAEDIESDDEEDIGDDQTHLTYSQQPTGQNKTPNLHTDDDVIVLPIIRRTTSDSRHSQSEGATQIEMTAQIQAGDVTGDHHHHPHENDDSNQPPELQRMTSQNENYFSEHS